MASEATSRFSRLTSKARKLKLPNLLSIKGKRTESISVANIPKGLSREDYVYVNIDIPAMYYVRTLCRSISFIVVDITLNKD
jgi:hypothetical protein